MTKQKKFKLGPLQRKWLRALKSGKYKKAKGQLEKNGGFCCLGVANKVCKLGEDSNCGGLINHSKIGLKNGLGHIVGGFYKFPRGTKEYISLADMNDGKISHKKIADFIEKNPELVFTESV